MSTSSNEANETNDDFIQAVEAFAEKHGYAQAADRIRATDPSQGQGTTVVGSVEDEMQGYVLSRLSR